MLGCLRASTCVTCVCVGSSACLVDSSAFPCLSLSSFLLISSQSSSFLASILLPPLSQGVWEQGDTVSLAISRKSTFPFPKQLDPRALVSVHPCHKIVAWLQGLPRTDWPLVPVCNTLGPGASSCTISPRPPATLALLRGCQWPPWEIYSVHEQLTVTTMFLLLLFARHLMYVPVLATVLWGWHHEPHFYR